MSRKTCRHEVLAFDEGGYRIICRNCDVKWINASWSASSVRQSKNMSEFRDGDRVKSGSVVCDPFEGIP